MKGSGDFNSFLETTDAKERTKFMRSFLQKEDTIEKAKKKKSDKQNPAPKKKQKTVRIQTTEGEDDNGQSEASGAEDQVEEPETTYFDRAAARRIESAKAASAEAVPETTTVQTEEDSKYLGGDVEHTHLVKGLDYVLLDKIKKDLNSQEVEKMPVLRKRVAGSFEGVQHEETRLILKTLFSGNNTLDPDFGKKQKQFLKLLSEGREFKNRNKIFLPGRLTFLLSETPESLPSHLKKSIVQPDQNKVKKSSVILQESLKKQIQAVFSSKKFSTNTASALETVVDDEPQEDEETEQTAAVAVSGSLKGPSKNHKMLQHTEDDEDIYDDLSPLKFDVLSEEEEESVAVVEPCNPMLEE